MTIKKPTEDDRRGISDDLILAKFKTGDENIKELFKKNETTNATVLKVLGDVRQDIGEMRGDIKLLQFKTGLIGAGAGAVVAFIFNLLSNK